MIHFFTSSHLADDVDAFNGDINLAIGAVGRVITTARVEGVTTAVGC
jgi:hypothetical protein